MKIVSGGQTGVDRAALDIAIALQISHGGWCPKGRKAEDGAIHEKYSLKETPSSDYSQRTQWNVRDSDATLVLAFGIPEGGTKFTLDSCATMNKPFLIVDLDQMVDPQMIRSWIDEARVRVLNIAGPRESFRPGFVYTTAFELLKKLFKV